MSAATTPAIEHDGAENMTPTLIIERSSAAAARASVRYRRNERMRLITISTIHGSMAQALSRLSGAPVADEDLDGFLLGIAAAILSTISDGRSVSSLVRVAPPRDAAGVAAFTAAVGWSIAWALQQRPSHRRGDQKIV